MKLNTTTKDTFWNRLRHDKGITLKALAVALDMDQASLSHYLTGMKLPSTPVSVKICDYFDLDYATGAEEFNKAHEEWVANNLGSKKKRSHIRSRKFDVSNIPAETPKTVPVCPTNIIEQLSNQIPTVTVTAVAEPLPEVKVPDSYAKEVSEALANITEVNVNVTSKRDSILRLIYRKVDYDTYNEVVKVLDS